MSHYPDDKFHQPQQAVSRRSFLRGSGVGAAVMTLPALHGVRAQAEEQPGTGSAFPVTLNVNGVARPLSVEPQMTLAEALRGPLDLTGTKIGCDRGACSACTVWVDGVPMLSCMMLAVEVGERKITTIEGLAREGELHPVQSAFIAHDAVQCGYCTPGMVMSCAALIESNPRPSPDDVKTAIAGHLCRCGTYPHVHAAMQQLAERGKELIMAPTDTRLQRHPFGIAGVALSEVERRVELDEPPPLPVNSQLGVIGKPVPRINGRAKVTGSVRFTVDVKLPGMLHGRLLRSPHPHARIRSIDTRVAERDSAVRAVHVISNVVGHAIETGAEGAAKSGRKGLYVGDPIAAVAATTPAAARAALDLIKVDYEVLPFVVDLDDARRPDAPPIFQGPVRGDSFSEGELNAAGRLLVGNVRGPNKAGSRGDIGQGFGAADVVVEGEFRTQVQTHCCLEPHAVVADWRPESLTVYMSTQYTAGVRNELAAAFGLPLAQVRVIVDAMGGGFGSKSGAGNYVRAAVALSRRAGTPVRLVLDRDEEQIDSGNRPSTVQQLRIGARRDGGLTAISLSAYGTAGVATGAGAGNIAQAMYECPNFDVAQSDVFTNAGPGCPMRAPGNVPGAFALEQLIDELAEKLAVDPLILRDRIDASAVRREERRIGAERIGWHRRQPAGVGLGPIKRGLGMAQSYWPANVQTNSACEVRILRDGSVEVLSSVQDIGTGIGTVLAQIVAEEFGLQPADIAVRIGDTEFPAGPPSYGSMTTASITPAARNAAHQALQMLFRAVAPSLDTTADQLSARDGRIVAAGQGRSIGFRAAAARLRTDRISAVASRSDDYGGFGRKFGDMASARNHLGGVQFAEVLVDTETGKVRVERVVAVQDCGRPMNPLQIESQIQGGILQGISYALLEERVLDRRSGHMLNADLEHYKIIGAGDIPAIEVHLIENYQGMSSTDAYGIAEPSNIATAPAVANAIYNAIGVRLRRLPMTPAAVLGALDKVQGRRP